MKVCIFAGNYTSPEAGGGHTFESQILAALVEFASESNHTFVLFNRDLQQVQKLPQLPAQSSPELPKPFAVKYSISGAAQIKSIILNKLRPIVKNFKFLKIWHERVKLNELIENNVDIVLSLAPGFLTTEVPYITIVWDLEHRRQPYFPELSAAGEWDSLEAFYTIMLKRASIVLTGTKAGKAEIEHFYQVASERIKVLPFPTSQFALNAPTSSPKKVLEKYNISENYLLYPAQLWPHKNHVGLLLAVKFLKEKYNLTFPVVFVGSDKGNQAYVRQVAEELNLSQQVHFLGFVPQEDLIFLYRQAFALTFVTFCGPDNLPPLEAMALECPVIASNVPGAQEQLGDAALLVDPKSPEQIATAIKSLCDDGNLRQTLIQRGIYRAYKWTPKDYVKGIFSLLDDFATVRRCWER